MWRSCDWRPPIGVPWGHSLSLRRNIESLTKIWWGMNKSLAPKKSLRPKAMRLLFPNGCFTFYRLYVAMIYAHYTPLHA